MALNTIKEELQLEGHLKLNQIWDRNSHLAVLNLNFDKPIVTRVVSDARMTFSMSLSTVGGTLGLFTGFSLISLAEMVYWVYKGVLRGKP